MAPRVAPTATFTPSCTLHRRIVALRHMLPDSPTTNVTTRAHNPPPTCASDPAPTPQDIINTYTQSPTHAIKHSRTLVPIASMGTHAVCMCVRTRARACVIHVLWFVNQMAQANTLTQTPAEQHNPRPFTHCPHSVPPCPSPHDRYVPHSDPPVPHPYPVGTADRLYSRLFAFVHPKNPATALTFAAPWHTAPKGQLSHTSSGSSSLVVAAIRVRLYVPAAHGTHVLAADAPATTEYDPAPHATQSASA